MSSEGRPLADGVPSWMREVGGFCSVFEPFRISYPQIQAPQLHFSCFKSF
jgi:hypothetical protein